MAFSPPDIMADRGPEHLYKLSGVVPDDECCPADLTPEDQTVRCETCLSDCPAHDCTSMDCGHTFCNDCWARHIEVGALELEQAHQATATVVCVLQDEITRLNLC